MWQVFETAKGSFPMPAGPTEAPGVDHDDLPGALRNLAVPNGAYCVGFPDAL